MQVIRAKLTSGSKGRAIQAITDQIFTLFKALFLAFKLAVAPAGEKDLQEMPPPIWEDPRFDE